MKRTAITNLICSMIATVVLVIGILLIIIVSNNIGIGKPKLVLSSASATAMYSGETLSDPTWLLTEGDLKEGHTISVNVTGAQTNVGISENYISASIRDAAGEDVTEDYNIEYKPGILNVRARDLVVTAGSAMKLYDGTPLSCDSYTIGSALSLLDTDTIEVVVEGSIVDIGEEKNRIIDVTIQNEDGADVTKNYNIQAVDGTLIVYDLETLVFESDSDVKSYDGTPLVNRNWTLVSGELKSGHSANVTVTGSQTAVGSSDNTFTVKIVNNSGDDVTDKYEDIICKFGTLTVINATPDMNTPTGAVVFRVTSDVDDTVYLKMKSYGNYNMESKAWNDALEYNSDFSSLPSAYYFPSLALENGGAQTNELIIEPVAGIYALPYYSTYVSDSYQTSDAEIRGDGSYTYNVEYYNWDNSEGIVIPSDYQRYEDQYSQFVRDNYLYVDDETNAFLSNIISAQGFDASNPNIIIDVANYIQNAASYNMDYDVRVDSASNPIIAFLSQYKEGVCRHYAMAATHLYRSLGIPARYTVGFIGDVLADETVDITDERGHAWVEVYVDDIGWINVEVTGSSDGGGSGSGNGSGNDSGGNSGDSDAQHKIQLTITPKATEKLYDGTELVASQEVTGIEEFLELYGYTYEAIILGSTDLGKVESVIEQFIIRDATGEVIYDKRLGIGEDIFQITYKTGTVHVYLSNLTFESNSVSKIYDGMPLLSQSSDITHTGGRLYTEDGYTIVITPIASITNVGWASNSFKVDVYKDGENVTDHYKISYVYGKLIVSAREITITAASAEREFINGVPLVCNEIIYDQSSLAENEFVDSFSVVGERTKLGESSNIVESVVIKNASDDDVTSNYKITLIQGTLKVVPKK